MLSVTSVPQFVWMLKFFRPFTSCLTLCWQQMVTTYLSRMSSSPKLPKRTDPHFKHRSKRSLSYSPVKQHALNVGVVVQCDECNKWRLLFSKRKLAFHERRELEQLLSDISYSCGSKMEDLQLPEQLKCVEIRIHQCIDQIEKLYYSAYPNDVLCIHCGSTENILESWAEESIYPYCNDCSSKEKVYKRGATQKKK